MALYLTLDMAQLEHRRLDARDYYRTADAVRPYTGAVEFLGVTIGFIIEGYVVKKDSWGTIYTELDLLKYLYKKNPLPELIAAIMELA